ILAHEVTHVAQHDLKFFRLVMMLQILTISVSRMGWILLLLLWPMTVAAGVRIPLFAIGLLLAAPVGSVLLQATLSRAREYAADLGAVELTGDPEGLASALERIDKAREQLWRQVLPVPQRERRGRSPLRTHPAQEERVGKLRELAAEMSS
ncbi:MAG: M48 family metalloprotease, partial [Spirochaetota bacterium]